MKPGSYQGQIAEIGRFLAAGAGNTLFSLAVYYLALLWADPSIAYAAAWLGGLVIVAAVYPTKVFRSPSTGLAGRIGFMLVYATSFLLGLLVIRYVANLGYDRLAAIAALMVTIPFNYVAMRAVLRLLGPPPHLDDATGAHKSARP